MRERTLARGVVRAFTADKPADAIIHAVMEKHCAVQRHFQ